MKKGIEVFEEMNNSKIASKCIGNGFRKHTVNHEAGWIDFVVVFELGGCIECIDKNDRNNLCEHLVRLGKKQSGSTSLGFESKF